MDHKSITDPLELEAISPSELFERVRPLLRKAGLTRNNEELRRIRPNIPSVCAELASAWERSPRLAEGEAPFGDYLAARLCTALRALDRQQHPELYDTHGKFQPDGQPQPLDEETLASTSPTPQATGAKEPLSITFRERKAQLANTLRNASIHPPHRRRSSAGSSRPRAEACRHTAGQRPTASRPSTPNTIPRPAPTSPPSAI